jgi:hypothetical protein
MEQLAVVDAECWIFSQVLYKALSAGPKTGGGGAEKWRISGKGEKPPQTPGFFPVKSESSPVPAEMVSIYSIYIALCLERAMSIWNI